MFSKTNKSWGTKIARLYFICFCFTLRNLTYAVCVKASKQIQGITLTYPQRIFVLYTYIHIRFPLELHVNFSKTTTNQNMQIGTRSTIKTAKLTYLERTISLLANGNWQATSKELLRLLPCLWKFMRKPLKFRSAIWCGIEEHDEKSHRIT